jgi:hypothetical protein
VFIEVATKDAEKPDRAGGNAILSDLIIGVNNEKVWFLFFVETRSRPFGCQE